MVTGRIGRIIERGLTAVAVAGHRRPWLALLLAAILASGAAVAARDIRLSADLTELLPQSFDSVQGLEKLKQRFGGIGYVVVVGQGADAPALRRFADDVAQRLERLDGIRWVEHRRATDFFKDHALYYLDEADLELVHDRIAARHKWERQQRNPLYVKLDDDPAPSLDFSDLERRYAARTDQKLGGTGEAYYLDERSKKVVVLAKPAGTSTDLGYARRLIDSVEAELAGMDLSRYGPDMRVELTGTFKKKIDQQRQIGSDIATASGLALLLMVGYLLFHFRNFASVLAVLLPTGLGLLWTYGLVGVAYGSVNLLTGFLGAILGGLGTEHGIHIIGRYAALRREGRSAEAATAEAFAHTGGSALVSAIVAALTFLSVAISEFRAFREFGVIAALGMLVVLVAYVAVLPALLALWARSGWRRPLAPDVPAARSPVARWLPLGARAIAPATVVLLVGLASSAADVRFDYDFAALEDGSLPSFRLDHEVNRILGYSQTPVVLLTDRPEDERAVVAELQRRRQVLGEASSIDFIGALDDIVPRDQVAKRATLERISQILDRIDPERLEAEQRSRFMDLRRAVAARPFGRGDLPASVRRQFEGIGNTGAGFVLVFPRVSLADGQKVRALAREVRQIPLASGQVVTAAGEAMVLADIIDMVTREAPLVLIAAVLSVLLATWLMLGSLGAAIVCIGPTILSLVVLLGLMPIAGLPFNYLNILVVPVLIGTTVDAGVHLMSRLGDVGEHFEVVYAETGRAVAGGLLTSAVGFGALLLAAHPGLQSIGLVAILGFAVNLLFMLVILPAGLSLRRRPAALPATQELPRA